MISALEEMSFIFDFDLDEDLVRKAQNFGISEFVRVQRNPEGLEAKKWYPKSYFLPSKYCQFSQKIENFHIRPDDVWIVTFPKCGTTWTQEMVWQICNNLDFERSEAVQLETRVPFFEFDGVARDELKQNYFETIDQMASPRLIKSHLPATLLPKEIWIVKPKIVYVARNTKDVVVSFFHHYRNFHGYQGSLDDFTEIFLSDFVNYSPFDSHIADFWNMRHEENILFLTYEDMKTNLSQVIQKTASFLGKSLTDQQIKIITEHLSFENMSKNLSMNFKEGIRKFQNALHRKKVEDKDENFNFLRKGKIASYLDDMTPEIIEKFDKWILERLPQYGDDKELLDIFLGN